MAGLAEPAVATVDRAAVALLATLLRTDKGGELVVGEGAEAKAARLAALRVRLEADDWLTTYEVADLFEVHPTTVHRMLATEPPGMRFRRRHGRGGYREIDPRDVRRELDKREQVHGEGPAPDA